MKHYLLTWYGITDLRAALGLEPTDGPILSALKTKKYTDTVILAYTNPHKSPHGFTDEIKTKWEKWRTADMETRLRFPRDKAQQFIDTLCNTELGHQLFADWLKSELAAHQISCNIQIISRELRHLNDAQKIYDAATAAVQLAVSDPTERTITTYVSPGTPVMAYTWALIARAHPQLNIEVIASSEPRLPPETLLLPKNLLLPLVATPQTAKPTEYDAIIHLLGRERMPIYFGIFHFKAKTHIFITTRDYQSAGCVLSRCLPETCQGKTVIILDPFKPADTQKAVEKEIAKLPSEAKVGVNLTGGTKLMFAGALAACWEHGLEPFYFEINAHNIIFIRDGVTVPFIGIKSVSDYFTVNGFEVIKNGLWEDNAYRAERTGVTQELWKARQTLGKLYQKPEFRKYKIPWGNQQDPPFDWSWGNSRVSFNKKRDASLILNGVAHDLPACDDYGSYLGGGWLEEYVFMLLRQLEEKDLIYDLRIGMEVSYSDKICYPKKMPTGEFDCVFTDGKRLWLVECKAGNVKQEDIQKLENNLKTYGGIAARGILVSSFPLDFAHKKRIASSESIYYLQSKEVLVEALEKLIKA